MAALYKVSFFYKVFITIGGRSIAVGISESFEEFTDVVAMSKFFCELIL